MGDTRVCGASRDHESLTSGESRSATKSEPPLLRLKALPSREALSRPYPPGPAACQNTKTPAAYTNRHENVGPFEDATVYEERRSSFLGTHETSGRADLRGGRDPSRGRQPDAAEGRARPSQFSCRFVYAEGVFVSDDATKPERVNTTKRQRKKRALAKFLSRCRFGGFNRAKRDLSRHRLS